MMRLLHFLLFLGLFRSSTNALKHNFVVKNDARTFIAPIGTPYGFLEGGCFSFDVVDFSIETGHKGSRKKKGHSNTDAKKEDILRSVEVGFLLKRFASEGAFTRFEEEISMDPSKCIFEAFQTKEGDQLFDDDDDFPPNIGEVMSAAQDGIFLRIPRSKQGWKTNPAPITYKFKEGESGLYFLMYQIYSNNGVKPDMRSTFGIDFHYKNTDFLGSESYLTAGEMPLPIIFFYFSVSYLLCLCIWIKNIRSINQGNGTIFGGSTHGQRIMVYPIHNVMSVLLLIKTITTFFESVRYHYLRIKGNAAFWSVVYYTFSFFKGIFLFTTILLIGSGWSFVKPFLTDREKKLIFTVLFLQVLDNIALTVLGTLSEGENAYDDWSALLHLVDIVCCCAVLFPIFWQVSALEEKLDGSSEVGTNEDSENTEKAPDNEDSDKNYETDENPAGESNEIARTLSKLKLFRTFYILVVAYIYTTRIAVYLLATTLDFKHTYVRYLVTELATLAFYVVTGLQFRPIPDNPYLAVLDKKDDDDDEIEFEQGMTEIELASSGIASSRTP